MYFINNHIYIKHLEDLLSQLNEVQQQAVSHIDGPVMVIAGAGSGKTRVLTYRIAYMIAQGISPFNILSLTFTNKAAQEMKDRVVSLLGDAKGNHVWMGTFHSVFSKILHIEATYLDFTSNFTIYDTDDCKSLVKTILKENNLDTKEYKVTTVISEISSAKSNMILPEDYIANDIIAANNKARRMPELGRIYSIYNSRLKQSDAMDFDDLLTNMYILLRDFPEILLKYQHKFRYIMVDEYQDTNGVQYKILKKLAGAYENICVVGDDAQSIYSFRGADIGNILGFQSDYPDCEVYKLEQNYRSTQNIINAANGVIAHNRRQIPKLIWTANQQGEKLQLACLSSDLEEALYVVKTISKLKEKHNYRNEDFVVMYRVNSQSRTFEEAFRRMNIPYRIYGGISFYDRKEIKDMMAYFRLTVNYKDEEALRRIINYPQRGIGATTMEKLIAAADDHKVSLWEVVENPLQYNVSLSSGIINTLDIFVNKIKSFHAELQQTDAFLLGKHIAQSSGMEQALMGLKDEPERYQNLGELFNAMQDFVNRPADTRIDMETGEDLQDKFPSLDLFLNEAALYTDADKDDENPDKVKLMTVHATKGLEFPCIFVVGMDEGLFPSSMVSSDNELEEERRLFYVALTRAKERVYMTTVQSRMIFGNVVFSQPSSFLKEIDTQLLAVNREQESQATRQNYYYKPVQKTASSYVAKPVFRQATMQKPTFNMPHETPAAKAKPSISLAPVVLTANTSAEGMRVYHAKFGEGVILEINKEDNRVKVDFGDKGQKTLLYNFAKLQQIIDNE